MKNDIQKKYKLKNFGGLKYILAFLFFFLLCTPTQAANINFKVINKSPTTIDVIVDTSGETINSAEIKLSYPKGLKFIGSDLSKSVISIWLKEPQLDRDGNIFFSGITPGGIERLYDPENLDQRAITLARLNFAQDGVVNGEFKIIESLVLKNDGKGTSLVTENTSLQYNSNSKTDSNIDNQIPNPFEIKIMESSNVNPRIAIFNTTDNETGIARYEVKSGLSKYISAESPYPIPYRLWAYKLSIRAIDYGGNVREESILIPGNKVLLIVSILGVLFVAYLIYNWIRRRPNIS